MTPDNEGAMAWQLDGYRCVACGDFHDLCDDGAAPDSLTATYGYVCPTTGREVLFREFAVYRKVGECPSHAVRIRRFDPPGPSGGDGS
jgi:hypothetical protein